MNFFFFQIIYKRTIQEKIKKYSRDWDMVYAWYGLRRFFYGLRLINNFDRIQTILLTFSAIFCSYLQVQFETHNRTENAFRTQKFCGFFF